MFASPQPFPSSLGSPVFKEHAPSRKAGAKVGKVSFHARGIDEIFENIFTCFYYAVPMIITQETDRFFIKNTFQKCGNINIWTAFFRKFEQKQPEPN